jgi:TRAP-type transport system periplasmic protein
VSELVSNHVEFGGPEALYTATIVLVMNKDRYESLPEDIRAAIDAESGEKLAAFASQVMWDYDVPARKIAVDRGNNIVQLDEAEVARWKEKAQPVVDRWVADMETKGIDGRALIQQAKDLIVQNGG